MKQRTKNYLLATIVAAIIGTGLTVSCASQKLSVTQNNAEIVPSVNAKPEVVWSEDARESKIYRDYSTQFKIPDDYLDQKPRDDSNGRSWSAYDILLTMPDLKPLPFLKRRCRLDMPNLKCLQGVLEIQGGHDLNRQVFKDKGINEDNYLNYYFDKSRGENYHNDVNTYYSKHQPIYGLTVYKRSKLTTEYTPAGKKIKLTDFDNRYLVLSPKTDVDTVIECPSDELNDEYIVKVNRKMPTCVHSFILKPYKMQLFLIYERKYLPQWQKIQNSTIQVINQFHQGINLKQGDK